MIVWFDLETTGLDFADDVVLEVAAIATDESLALESEPFHALIRPDAEGLGRLALTPVVAVMHANSGLLADLFGGEVPFWNTAESGMCRRPISTPGCEVGISAQVMPTSSLSPTRWSGS